MALVTYLEAIRDGLREEMERDERVFMMGEDIGAFGGAFKVTEGFQTQFGAERVIDTPIAETAFVGAAAGAAHMGFRPVCEVQRRWQPSGSRVLRKKPDALKASVWPSGILTTRLPE